MTNTIFTDAVDVLGTVLGAIGASTQKIDFLFLSALCFIISFGARLIIDARIEKYLKGIRDKVNK